MVKRSVLQEGFIFAVVFMAGCLFYSGLLPGSAEATIVNYRGKILDIARPGETVPDQIIVQTQSGAGAEDVLGRARQLNGNVIKRLPEAGLYLLQFPDAASATAAYDQLKKERGKLVPMKNYKMSIPAPPEVLPELYKDFSDKVKELPGMKNLSASGKPAKIGDVSSNVITPGDPAATNCWWRDKIREPWAPAPPLAATAPGIAIVDTGIDYTHPDLTARYAGGYDVVNDDNDPFDDNGHGTHCAGIAAATMNNNTGIRGVSPTSMVYSYKVLDGTGSGDNFGVLAGLRMAADNPNVKVISMSLGGYVPPGAEYNAFVAAVNYAVNTKKKIVVVAAGNDSNVELYYWQYYDDLWYPVPAWVPSSFTVAATDQNDKRADFSNYDVTNLKSSDNLETYNYNFVDIAAPGYEILSTVPGFQYASWSGTSMSTPMVAGAAARVWGTAPNTLLTNAQIQTKLLSTGKSLGPPSGFPVVQIRIDVAKALGVTKTGIQGQVIDGESGVPARSVTVAAKVGTTTKTATTDYDGFFTITELPAGACTVTLTRAGFATTPNIPVLNVVAGIITDLAAPLPIVRTRAATTAAPNNVRIAVVWGSSQLGYTDWYYDPVFNDCCAWYPYYYYSTPGLEANSYLTAPDATVYYWHNRGALGKAPYVAYTHDSFFDTPVESHIIQKQVTGTYTYKVKIDPDDYGWGTAKYSPGTPAYAANPIAYIWLGNTFKQMIKANAATRVGTGTKFWDVFTLSGSTVTVQNSIHD